MKKKSVTLAELSSMVNGELLGEPDIVIHALADLASATKGEIGFLVKKSHVEVLKKSHGSAFIVPKELDYDEKPLIKVRSRSKKATPGPGVMVCRCRSKLFTEDPPVGTGLGISLCASAGDRTSE